MGPAVAVVVLVACWTGGVLLATTGRHWAARYVACCRVSYPQVLKAQLAGTALNRLLPAGGGLVLAHLELLDRPAPDEQADGAESRLAGRASALLAYAVAGAVTHALLLVATGALVTVGVVALPPLQPPEVLRPGWLWALALTVPLLAGALSRLLPSLTRRAWECLIAAVAQVRQRPRRVGLLVLPQLAATLLSACALAAALTATGPPVALPRVLLVFVLASSVAGLLPVPGGLGTLDGALVAGLVLAGVGVGPATAAVALFRLVTYWLPIPLGMLAGATTLRHIMARRVTPRRVTGTFRPTVRWPGSAGPARRAPTACDSQVAQS